MSNEHHGPPCLIATFDTITEIILMNARLVHSMTNTSTTFVNALINETRSIILGTRVCVGKKFPFDWSGIFYSAVPSQCKIQNCGGNESNQSKENSLSSQTLGLLGLKTGI